MRALGREGYDSARCAPPALVRVTAVVWDVSRRVIPNTGCSTEVGPYIVFGCGGCSTLNFSKSVNSFGLAVFFRNFLRPMLAIRTAKSQNEFATTEFHCNRAWAMPPESQNFNAKIDIVLELGIDRHGQVDAISEHLALPKNTGPPRSSIYSSAS